MKMLGAIATTNATIERSLNFPAQEIVFRGLGIRRFLIIITTSGPVRGWHCISNIVSIELRSIITRRIVISYSVSSALHIFINIKSRIEKGILPSFDFGSLFWNSHTPLSKNHANIDDIMFMKEF
uniref:Uncharacterized protein n=1 Tax=Aplanochytrium stocchinoi TaxID=215587 RepID=A0A7S3PEJ5_9STRA